MTIEEWLKTGIVSLLIPALLGGGCLTASGCAFIKPTTQLDMNPITRTISFVDTKDNDVEINGVHWADGPDGKSFTVESVIVANKASPVIEANVQQMLAFVEQQRAANEGIAASLAGLAQMITAMSGPIAALGEAIPAVSGEVKTDWGDGSVVVTPQSQTPATQPTGTSEAVDGGP